MKSSILDLRTLKILFDEIIVAPGSTTRTKARTKAHDFILLFESPLDFLADFSKMFRGYDISLPMAFKEIICTDPDEREKRLSLMLNIRGRISSGVVMLPSLIETTYLDIEALHIGLCDLLIHTTGYDQELIINSAYKLLEEMRGKDMINNTKPMPAFKKHQVADLLNLKGQFDKSYTSNDTSAVNSFIRLFENPLEMLADFSVAFSTYDESLPRALKEVVCGGSSNVFENIQSLTTRLRELIVDNKCTLDQIRSTYATDLYLYNSLCDLIVLSNGGYKRKILPEADRMRNQVLSRIQNNDCYAALTKDTHYSLGEILKNTPGVPPELISPELISSTAKEKENHMADVGTVAILKELAKTPDAKDDLSSLITGVSSNLDKALAELKAEEDVNKAKREAKIIMDILRRCEVQISLEVERVREIRRQEKERLKTLATITRAKAFAAETKNFLPMLYLLDGYVPGTSSEEVKVPEDWKPKNENPQS